MNFGLLYCEIVNVDLVELEYWYCCWKVVYWQVGLVVEYFGQVEVLCQMDVCFVVLVVEIVGDDQWCIWFGYLVEVIGQCVYLFVLGIVEQ